MRKIHLSGIHILFFAATLFFLQNCQKKQEAPWITIPPAHDQYLAIDPAGKAILPNGRIVAPAGKTFKTAHTPMVLH
jgi:hypothetical protein